MVRGGPDFGAYSPKAAGAGLTDLAELAVRLGSIDSVDRRGDILLLDDFDDSFLRWETKTFSAGSECVRDEAYPKRGDGCVKMAPAANDLAYARINRYLEIPRNRQLGFEISTTIAAGMDDLLHGAELFDGSTKHFARVKVDIANSLIAVFTTGASYSNVLTGMNLYSSNYMWYTIKLVWDWTTGFYKRLLWNGQEYDLSAIPIYSVPSGGPTRLDLEVQANGLAGGAATQYLDDAILTQNEP